MGTIIVEPEGSECPDPHTGDPLHRGSQAMIKNPVGEDFRGFALLYHDFAQLVDRNGELVTEQVQHNKHAGVMVINYRNAPYYHRDDEGHAYLHSSAVHGDPPTPVLETYPDDPVRIRLVNGL